MRADVNAAARQVSTMTVNDLEALDIAVAVVASSCVSKLASLTGAMKQKVTFS